jgi:hypothetical protein
MVAAYQPDVVVSQLGVNDLTYGWSTPAGLVEQSRRLVDQVRAASPDTDVVLGALFANWDSRMAEYNRLLPALEDMSTPESRVVVTTMPPNTTAADTYDGMHPSDTAEVKIANAVGGGLNRLGIVVDTARLTPAYQAPPAPRLHVDRGPRVIRLTWTKRASTSATVYRAVRKGHWKPLASGVKTGRLNTYTLEGTGLYRWKVRAFNHTKASPFSNVVRVRVRR